MERGRGGEGKRESVGGRAEERERERSDHTALGSPAAAEHRVNLRVGEADGVGVEVL